MKRFLFDMITSPLSLFENPFYNYVAMALIAYISFKIAYKIVGELGLRGEFGSIVHWTIRLIVMLSIWILCSVIIIITKYIITNWITILLSIVMGLLLYILKKYAKENPSSILNKKII